jgi:hypothetical protein
MYSPALHRFCDKLISTGRSSGRTRGIVFGLKTEDLMQLYFRQSGVCALSGIPMTFAASERTHGRSRTNISIDRIDSRGNYTLDNVQLVCVAVNIMKMDLSVDELVRWCTQIIINNS